MIIPHPELAGVFQNGGSAHTHTLALPLYNAHFVFAVHSELEWQKRFLSERPASLSTSPTPPIPSLPRPLPIIRCLVYMHRRSIWNTSSFLHPQRIQLFLFLSFIPFHSSFFEALHLFPPPPYYYYYSFFFFYFSIYPGHNHAQR